MDLKKLLGEGIYYNQALARAIAAGNSPQLELIRHNLARPGDPGRGAIDKRLGFHLDNVSPLRYVSIVQSREGEWPEDKEKKILSHLHGILERANLQTQKGRRREYYMKEYLRAGVKALTFLGFPHTEFTQEKLVGYMQLAEEAQPQSSQDFNELLLARLAEQALCRLLNRERIRFVAISFGHYNAGDEAREKATNKFILENGRSAEVIVQEEFTGSYLFPRRRLRQPDRIADYVVFFHHFAYHCFYVTGVLERSFLLSRQPPPADTAHYLYPENDPELVLSEYLPGWRDKTRDELGAALRRIFGRRLAAGSFLEAVRSGN